jgi:hypothetical protein
MVSAVRAEPLRVSAAAVLPYGPVASGQGPKRHVFYDATVSELLGERKAKGSSLPLTRSTGDQGVLLQTVAYLIFHRDLEGTDADRGNEPRQ